MAMLRANVQKMPNKSPMKNVAQHVSSSKTKKFTDIDTSNPFIRNLKKNSEDKFKSDPYSEVHENKLAKAKKSAHIRIEDLD